MDRPPHLVIDLNEAPSPPPSDTPPAQAPSPPRELAPPVQAPPPPQQQQLPPLLPPQPQPQPPLGAPNQQARLQQEALEGVLRVHRPLELRNTPFGPVGNVPAGLFPGLGLPLLPLPPPAPHPGEAGWGNPVPPCSSCGLPEILGEPWSATRVRGGSIPAASASGRLSFPRPRHPGPLARGGPVPRPTRTGSALNARGVALAPPAGNLVQFSLTSTLLRPRTPSQSSPTTSAGKISPMDLS
ncbi:hypothetical protein BDA96_04G082500 [Sorghum bicolor]|uniref:Uncharacterized protein n=1 Tax=Sorghum bicolor TaxID=4558 RepID=A0A921UIE0_SORBI|nr:hypothetical protein BDA96_04G082500 [Sorghum bicolor]